MFSLALRTTMSIFGLFGLIVTSLSISSGFFLFLTALEKSLFAFGLINVNTLVCSDILDVHYARKYTPKYQSKYHFLILFFVEKFLGILSCHKVLNREAMRVLLMVRRVLSYFKKSFSINKYLLGIDSCRINAANYSVYNSIT